MTPCATRAYEIADGFRERGAHVVLGGLHISLFPEEARPHADTLCIGEAEEIWPQFLRDIRAGRPGAEYRAGREGKALIVTARALARYPFRNAWFYRRLAQIAWQRASLTEIARTPPV